MERLEQSPCYGCEKRTDSCHPVCEDYIKYDRGRQEARKRRQKEAQARNDQMAIAIERQSARKRAWRDRKARRERGEHL